MVAHGIGDLCKSVTGQIHKPLPFSQVEEVDELRATGRLARTCELAPIDDYVDSAGLAGIRAARYSNLGAVVRDELAQGVGTLDEAGVRVLRHGVCPGDSVYNLGLLV